MVSAGIAAQPAFRSGVLERGAAARLRAPLATPENTPKHVSRDYYYALPERVLYKSYPIYHPSREPAGYLDTLSDRSSRSVSSMPAKLKTETDWIAAGRDVFEMPIDLRTGRS